MPLKKLVIATFQNYSDFLRAVDGLSSAEPLIQSGATHNGNFVLIFEGPSAAPLRLGGGDVSEILDPHPQLLKSYFKQTAVRVQKNLVCLEHVSLPKLFEKVNELLRTSDFQCVEINRSLIGRASALLANGSDIEVAAKVKDCQVTLLEHPSENLKKIF